MFCDTILCSFFTDNKCGLCGKCYMFKVWQESFKMLFEKDLVKNMMYLVWELNPRLSVHETDTLPSELTRFYICQAGFEPTTFRTTVWHSTNWAIGRTNRIWVQEYNLFDNENMFQIVRQRITSCACVLLKIKSTKTLS